MKNIFLYSALLILGIVGCQNGKKDGKLTKPDIFFDLRGYMESEIERLSETQPNVLKRIAIDGNQEERTVDSLDYQKELGIFLRSDINKTAWIDKYQVDSTFREGKLHRIVYTATDEDLKTHLLEIEFSGGQVSQVHVQNRTESIVADVGQDMWYYAGRGYSLESGQSTALTEEKKIKVEVEFLE